MDIRVLAAWAAVGALGAGIVLNAGEQHDSGHPFGSQEVLRSVDGTIATYTVHQLAPSGDLDGVRGRLYEATVTVQAVAGDVTPVVGMFNARTPSGQMYPALADTTQQGLTRNPLTQGSRATGCVYFDVIDDAPDSVVVNNGMGDLMVWDGISPDQPAPPPPIHTRDMPTMQPRSFGTDVAGIAI